MIDEVGWISATNGEIPEGAVVWGENKRGSIYLARAQHEGIWLPALLFPGLKQVRLDCNEGFGLSVRKNEYQVLCNVQEDWRFMKSELLIPYKASLLISVDANKHDIYVGRVKLNNFVTAGLVSSYDWRCRATIGGKIKFFRKFEILTIPNLNTLQSIQDNKNSPLMSICRDKLLQQVQENYTDENYQPIEKYDSNNKEIDKDDLQYPSRIYVNLKFKNNHEKCNCMKNIFKHPTYTHVTKTQTERGKDKNCVQNKENKRRQTNKLEHFNARRLDLIDTRRSIIDKLSTINDNLSNNEGKYYDDSSSSSSETFTKDRKLFDSSKRQSKNISDNYFNIPKKLPDISNKFGYQTGYLSTNDEKYKATSSSDLSYAIPCVSTADSELTYYDYHKPSVESQSNLPNTNIIETGSLSTSFSVQLNATSIASTNVEDTQNSGRNSNIAPATQSSNLFDLKKDVTSSNITSLSSSSSNLTYHEFPQKEALNTATAYSSSNFINCSPYLRPNNIATTNMTSITSSNLTDPLRAQPRSNTNPYRKITPVTSLSSSSSNLTYHEFPQREALNTAPASSANFIHCSPYLRPNNIATTNMTSITSSNLTDPLRAQPRSKITHPLQHHDLITPVTVVTSSASSSSSDTNYSKIKSSSSILSDPKAADNIITNNKALDTNLLKNTTLQQDYKHESTSSASRHNSGIIFMNFDDLSSESKTKECGLNLSSPLLNKIHSPQILKEQNKPLNKTYIIQSCHASQNTNNVEPKNLHGSPESSSNEKNEPLKPPELTTLPQAHNLKTIKDKNTPLINPITQPSTSNSTAYTSNIKKYPAPLPPTSIRQQGNNQLTNEKNNDNQIKLSKVQETGNKSTLSSTYRYEDATKLLNQPIIQENTRHDKPAFNRSEVAVASDEVNEYWCSGKNGTFDKNAVVGGWNHLGPIYVVRYYYDGSWIPAKMIPDYEKCIFYCNGCIMEKREYQVLCMIKYRWAKMSASDEIPPNAVSNVFGNKIAKSTEYYYIGRAKHDASITCGRVERATRSLHIVYGGQEHIFKKYEILINTENAGFFQKIFHGISELFESETPTSNFRRPIEKILDEPESPMSENFRLLSLGKKSHDYQYVSKLMNDTISQHRGNLGGFFTKYKIEKIEQIFNKDLWENYTIECKKIMKKKIKTNEMRLFHGSPKSIVIAKEGFDEKHASLSGMFGAGIYFAEHSSKSNQYAFGYAGSGCTKHSNSQCYVCDRQMLLCRVLLGKVAEFTSAQKNLAHAPVGCNSVKGIPSTHGLNYPEYIIYRGEQAYPGYLITYKISP